MEKNSSLRSKIENHIGIFFFGTLITGFIAGITVYTKTMELLRYKNVHEDKIAMIEMQNAEDKDENRQLRESVISLRIELSKVGKFKETEINSPITIQDVSRKIEENRIIQEQQKKNEEQKKRELEQRVKILEKQRAAKKSQEDWDKFWAVTKFVAIVIAIIAVSCILISIGAIG